MTVSSPAKIFHTLPITLGNGLDYNILIGTNLIDKGETFLPWVNDKEVLIVTNPKVGSYYLEQVKKAISPLVRKLIVVEVIDSEQAKSPKYLEKIYQSLLENNFSRQSLIIALGGGVVGDLAGYAAATYQRGIKFLQIPTSLLAQVDASIGGKTAINHPLGKNMIGAFHQPSLVVIDLNVLQTLDQREFCSGLSEVIKYGLIFSESFIDYLENNMDAILNKDIEKLSYIIKESCSFKAKVVIADEKEKGERALLNLGHTYGHPIESNQDYGEWFHGEAISTGMILAMQASLILKEQSNLAPQSNDNTKITLEAKDIERVTRLFQKAKLPTTLPANMSNEDFLSYMARDKKNLADQIVLILMHKIGQAYVEKKASRELINQSLDCLRNKR